MYSLVQHVIGVMKRNSVYLLHVSICGLSSSLFASWYWLNFHRDMSCVLDCTVDIQRNKAKLSLYKIYSTQWLGWIARKEIIFVRYYTRGLYSQCLYKCFPAELAGERSPRGRCRVKEAWIRTQILIGSFLPTSWTPLHQPRILFRIFFLLPLRFVFYFAIT